MQFVDTDVFYNYSLSLVLKGMAANIEPPFFVVKSVSLFGLIFDILSLLWLRIHVFFGAPMCL